MSARKTGGITHQFLEVVKISSDNRFDRFFVPVLLGIGIAYTGLQLMTGDFGMAGVSAFSLLLLLLLATFKPLQLVVLRKRFDRRHATYIALFWVYSLLWVSIYRSLDTLPVFGKDSRLFYVLLILFFAITFRALCCLYALTRPGYKLFITDIPLWELGLVAVNEFIAAGLLAFVGGGLLAQLLQPDVFTLYVDPVYTSGLLIVLVTYYLGMFLMWLESWNAWLGRNVVWVRLARFFAPLALVVATLVILRHFVRLSDPRTVNLLGTADLDQAVLALSPVVWMMILFVVMLVYTGGRGLRQRFLPDMLLELLPVRLGSFLRTISDMDMLLIAGLFSTSIPLHLFLFDDEAVGVIDFLRQQIAQDNALIDTSEQALSLIFALPFYLLAVGLLVLYAYVLANPQLSARQRDALVERLPVGLLIIFIITLYLCAIPFSLVLTQGRLPQLPQELGRVLAFDVLIPLVLLYLHYFFLVRLPYGRGQAAWREREAQRLETLLEQTQHDIRRLDADILRIERSWSGSRHNSPNERLNTLYRFVELNGKRDQLNMERLHIVAERQHLAEVSEAPMSIAVARLPIRLVSFGVPLLLVFKIYEWAVFNDGLREVANNPNIGVIEFFQTILQQTQF